MGSEMCIRDRPTIVSVLPNFTNLSELADYTSAVDTPPLSEGDQAILDDLWANDFYYESVPI